MFVDETRAGLRLRRASAWHDEPVVHGFTDRLGGVSEAPYHSLNVGLHVGDDPDAVRTNRERIAGALGRSLDGLVVGEQVHGADVVVVSEGDGGRGALGPSGAVPGADGLVTASSEIWLMAFFADCVPILLYDPERPAVGVAHAGWKGTAADVAGRAVEAMQKAFGSRPERIQAALGPSIGPCCYAVGDDVAAQIEAATATTPDGGPSVTAKRVGRTYADLPSANRALLLRAGLSPDQVFVDWLCTRCQSERFFSHRGDGGRTGRFAAVIGLASRADG